MRRPRSPRSRGWRRRSAAGRSCGSSARTSSRWRSAATSCATSSRSSRRPSRRVPTALVTAGRRWSNHCRLTAAAGTVAGLQVHLVLSGPATTPRNPGARLDELLGAAVHQAVTADRAEREALVERVVTDLRAAGHRPYVIGVGGGGVLGASGQLGAAAELLAQAHERSLEVAGVIVPSATGGTQAGLLAGLRAGGSAAAVVGIAVAHPPAELRPAIATLLDGLGRLTGVRSRRARSSSTATGSAPATARRRRPPRRPPACSPGPRACSSIRSTRPRVSPA